MPFHSPHTAIWWFYTQTMPFALASVCNTEERNSQQGLQIWFSLETGLPWWLNALAFSQREPGALQSMGS